MVSTAPRSSYFPKSLNCRNCLRCSTLRVPSLEADTRVCVLSGENDRSRTTSLWSMRITWRRPVQEKQYTLVHGAKIRTNTFLSFFFAWHGLGTFFVLFTQLVFRILSVVVYSESGETIIAQKGCSERAHAVNHWQMSPTSQALTLSCVFIWADVYMCQTYCVKMVRIVRN